MSRESQKKYRRENRRIERQEKSQEEALDRQNAFGIQDPTPQAAVAEIIIAKRRKSK